MTEQEARDDLEAKVRELSEPLIQVCVNRLQSLQLSGSGIVQEHMDHDCNYVVPKAYMNALIRVMRYRFELYETEHVELSNNYYNLM